MIPALPNFRKPSFSETPDERNRNSETKKKLLNELSNTVKELQKTHLEDDLDVDKNDEHALMLCTLLEAALLHGYQDTVIKMSNFYNLLGKISAADAKASNSFWNLVVHFTHKDIKKEVEHLSHITTPIGQCRAWIRLALNDCLIESYLDAMLSDTNKLRLHYKPGAFMLEEEMPYIMISFLQGLVEFKFNLNYNTPSLNSWSGDTLVYAGILQMAQLAKQPQYTSHVHVPSFTTSRSTSRPLSSIAAANRPMAIAKPQEEEVEIAKSVEEYDDVGKTNVEDSQQENARNVVIKTQTESTSADFTELPEERPDRRSPSSTSIDDDKENHPKTPVDVRDSAVSPVPLLGSNKLGVRAGWSSAFDTGPHLKSPDISDSRRSLSPLPLQPAVKDMPASHSSPGPELTYTNLFSSYKVQGSNTFDTSMFEQEGMASDKEHAQRDIPRMKSPDNESHMPGFEVVPQSSSVQSNHSDDRIHTLMANLTHITNEKGLDYQKYQCNGCGRNIGMIYGEAKVCKYDSCYYCYECHVDDEHVIPARMIYNWDLRKHSVCRSTKLFLLQIEEEPLLNIDETNPSLYAVIDELQEIRMLRKQLQHLKGFLFTCKEPVAEEVRRRIWPREYLWDDIHQYSTLDLIQTSSGQLAHHIKKIISFCKKHVYKCQLCCQKGFICEFCNDPRIIYPFQINSTTQCPKCKAVFHKSCISDRSCPKCTRRQKLQSLKSKESNFDSPWE